jgi:hypothetical protein
MMRAVCSPHQGLRRMPVLFASSREQQAGLIGFDFVFNTRTLSIQMAHVEEITIHPGTDQ